MKTENFSNRGALEVILEDHRAGRIRPRMHSPATTSWRKGILFDEPSIRPAGVGARESVLADLDDDGDLDLIVAGFNTAVFFNCTVE